MARYMSRRASGLSLRLVCLVYLVAAAIQAPSAARASASDPYIAYNTRSGIFHHPECNSALACTRKDSASVRLAALLDAASRGIHAPVPLLAQDFMDTEGLRPRPLTMFDIV